MNDPRGFAKAQFQYDHQEPDDRDIEEENNEADRRGDAQRDLEQDR